MPIEVRTATETLEEARMVAHELVTAGLCAFGHIDIIETPTQSMNCLTFWRSRQRKRRYSYSLR